MRANAQHTSRLTLLLLGSCVWWLGFLARAEISIPTNVMAFAQSNLLAARSTLAAESTNSVAAVGLARACFAWGKMLKDPTAKEKTYTEGVAAARRATALDSNSAPAHYYLGMNIGRVADLKRNLAAFGMVKEVEREFTRAVQLDASYSQAGPHRNLGLLYAHAPGWPVSVGNKKLARQHLEQAVKLAPDFPENRLNLAEAYREWKESKLFEAELAALDRIWDIAKTKFVGPEWDLDWIEWQQRREQLKASRPK